MNPVFADAVDSLPTLPPASAQRNSTNTRGDLTGRRRPSGSTGGKSAAAGVVVPSLGASAVALDQENYVTGPGRTATLWHPKGSHPAEYATTPFSTETAAGGTYEELDPNAYAEAVTLNPEYSTQCVVAPLRHAFAVAIRGHE
jgi:hypothetical protein